MNPQLAAYQDLKPQKYGPEGYGGTPDAMVTTVNISRMFDALAAHGVNESTIQTVHAAKKAVQEVMLAYSKVRSEAVQAGASPALMAAVTRMDRAVNQLKQLPA